MTNKEIQCKIETNVKTLLKSSPETLKAMAERASDAEQNVAYFIKINNKDRVRYEMRQFLHWLEKAQESTGKHL